MTPNGEAIEDQTHGTGRVALHLARLGVLSGAISGVVVASTPVYGNPAGIPVILIIPGLCFGLLVSVVFRSLVSTGEMIWSVAAGVVGWVVATFIALCGVAGCSKLVLVLGSTLGGSFGAMFMVFFYGIIFNGRAGKSWAFLLIGAGTLAGGGFYCALNLIWLLKGGESWVFIGAVLAYVQGHALTAAAFAPALVQMRAERGKRKNLVDNSTASSQPNPPEGGSA